MNRNEKNARKEKISKYVNLGNGHFKDSEIEKLESLIENREDLDGTSKTHRSSYKTFDSEDTYYVEEEDTYTLHCDEDGIYAERDFQRHWDDGQNDNIHEIYSSARDLLNLLRKII